MYIHSVKECILEKELSQQQQESLYCKPPDITCDFTIFQHLGLTP